MTVISPGVTRTDIADDGSNRDVHAQITAYKGRITMPPDAVARAIAFAIEQPSDVEVGEIIVRSRRRDETNRHDTHERSEQMTATNAQLDRPGGTASLAGRPVARIGFGAMQLPGPRVIGPPRDRATALAVLRQAVEMGVNHIDTAQFYGPDVANELIHSALHPYPEAEMAALRDEGKIGGIGLSNVTIGHLRQALPIGIACVQNAYSLLDRASEPLLDICREQNLAWVPFFLLGSAFPGVAKVTEHPAVVATATALGATPAQVGLAWLLAHAPQVLVIPGTSGLDHLAENIAAGQVHLDAKTMAVLDAVVGPTS